jgi:hypothetical protein
MKTSLVNIKLLEVIDELSSDTHIGGWQEWYANWWKRTAGCGPTVVATIMSYISRSRLYGTGECPPLTIGTFRELMEEVWEFVTPGFGGIPTTAALMKGARAYIAEKQLPFRLEELDIPKQRSQRPDMKVIINFLTEALSQDTPVAFLSLDKGKEELLDSWHWVTLLALDAEEDGSQLEADITDEGRLLHVNLKNWYETTAIGGGFVRFVRT